MKKMEFREPWMVKGVVRACHKKEARGGVSATREALFKSKGEGEYEGKIWENGRAGIVLEVDPR